MDGFTWEVPAEGDGYFIEERRCYHMVWVQGDHREPVLLLRPSASLRQYRPLVEEPGLFLTFAWTEPTEEGILALANRYGALGHIGAGVVLQEEAQRSVAPSPVQETGESVAKWRSAINALAVAVTTWDLIRQADVAELWRHLQELLAIPAYAALLRDLDPQASSAAGGADAARPPSGKRPAEVLAAGRSFLQALLNHVLSREAPVCAQLTWNPETGEDAVEDVPGSLYGAMYLQFARAIAGDKQFRQCAVCGRWMEMTPRMNRADRVTCSAACRQKLYRERQERARQLRSEGKTPKTIATELDTDIDTVKNWLKKGD